MELTQSKIWSVKLDAFGEKFSVKAETFDAAVEVAKAVAKKKELPNDKILDLSYQSTAYEQAT